MVLQCLSLLLVEINVFVLPGIEMRNHKDECLSVVMNVIVKNGIARCVVVMNVELSVDDDNNS